MNFGGTKMKKSSRLRRVWLFSFGKPNHTSVGTLKYEGNRNVMSTKLLETFIRMLPYDCVITGMKGSYSKNGVDLTIFYKMDAEYGVDFEIFSKKRMEQKYSQCIVEDCMEDSYICFHM